jgi:hypothetical protein
MTVDASRSCLCLGTCVGSTTRQMVDARVLLTATAPPALPGGSMSGSSLAPPCDAITGLLRSAWRRRHAPGDGPDEACQLTGDRGGDDIGRLAAASELAIAGACPQADMWSKVGPSIVWAPDPLPACCSGRMLLRHEREAFEQTLKECRLASADHAPVLHFPMDDAVRTRSLGASKLLRPVQQNCRPVRTTCFRGD